MAKKLKTEKRTIVGKVRNIAKKRMFEGEGVINVDIEIPSPDSRVFVDVAFWGTESHAILQGKVLDDEKDAWVKCKTPVTVGARLRVTGNYSVKSWKPTRSKKLGKVVRKGYIPVYDATQIEVRALPKL